MPELRWCNDTYTRGPDGIWRYPWGAPVPGAVDLTVSDLYGLRLGDEDIAPADLRPLSPAEVAWLQGETRNADGVVLRRPSNGRSPGAGDLVVGMQAPELHVLTMLTVTDIGKLARVSKATIDSYRYRGALPEPQVTRGRTPLWARPIVRHWLDNRPGCGWRSDLYGSTMAGT